MSLKFVKTKDLKDLPPQHECCICGKVGTWNRNWSWYGSLKDLEDINCDSGIIDKCCSKKCRDEYNKKHRIPYKNRGFEKEVDY